MLSTNLILTRHSTKLMQPELRQDMQKHSTPTSSTLPRRTKRHSLRLTPRSLRTSAKRHRNKGLLTIRLSPNYSLSEAYPVRNSRKLLRSSRKVLLLITITPRDSSRNTVGGSHYRRGGLALLTPSEEGRSIPSMVEVFGSTKMANMSKQCLKLRIRRSRLLKL